MVWTQSKRAFLATGFLILLLFQATLDRAFAEQNSNHFVLEYDIAVRNSLPFEDSPLFDSYGLQAISMIEFFFGRRASCLVELRVSDDQKSTKDGVTMVVDRMPNGCSLTDYGAGQDGAMRGNPIVIVLSPNIVAKEELESPVDRDSYFKVVLSHELTHALQHQYGYLEHEICSGSEYAHLQGEYLAGFYLSRSNAEFAGINLSSVREQVSEINKRSTMEYRKSSGVTRLDGRPQNIEQLDYALAGGMSEGRNQFYDSLTFSRDNSKRVFFVLAKAWAVVINQSEFKCT